MKKLVAVLFLLWASAAPAASLIEDLGGREQVAAFTRDFVERLVNDPRIGHFFVYTYKPGLARKLTDQFCALAGDDKPYRGATMQGAHEGLDISAADFNALVEDLQAAMDAHNVSFAVQSRLIALLAPMKRDIVTRP